MIGIIKFLALALTCTCSFPALAETVIEAYPTGWRLQNYSSTTKRATIVAVAYAGSTCIDGTLNFAASATEDDKNRFWSLILTAKVSNRPVGLFYETTSGACNITSFWAA